MESNTIDSYHYSEYHNIDQYRRETMEPTDSERVRQQAREDMQEEDHRAQRAEEIQMYVYDEQLGRYINLLY